MNSTQLQILEKHLPIWRFYQTNRCLPPVNLSLLQELASVYRTEMHPAPVRLYCSVCVQEMISDLYKAYEKHLKEKEGYIETNPVYPQPTTNN